MDYLQTWNGVRHCAIDGTSIQLFDETGIADHLGVQLCNSHPINFAQARSKLKHKIVRLILHARCDVLLIINRTMSSVSKTIEAVREGRSSPRRLKTISVIRPIKRPVMHSLAPDILALGSLQESRGSLFLPVYCSESRKPNFRSDTLL